MKSIWQLCYELESECVHGKGGAPANTRGVVRDPEVAKTKGAPKYSKCTGKKRRCTKYNKTGHNKRKHPQLKRNLKKECQQLGGFVDEDVLEEDEKLWSKFESDGN
ncbi:hypothetical protein PIB30_071371 [Stylosanthes scabra]|uniref:Zinc finger, CCHC-type n=1 Tax=Stylosanthes scabra TaxID=79078 RepID=A0ABU6UN41_9FABA|nr:hypothetical protein [Stylosanthes scabra]